MKNLDSYLGRKIFAPLIIRYCQWAGASQYRASKELDFAGWLVAIWMVRDAPGWMLAIGCLMAASVLVRLAIWPDTRGEEPHWFRGLCLGLITVDLALSVMAGKMPYWPLLFWLAASYANDIDNVPPKKKKMGRLVPKTI